MDQPVKTPYDLAYQSSILYGLIPGTLTWNYFRTSNDTAIRIMWDKMYSTRPSVFEWTSRKGIERVRESNGKYVFFVESAFADYLTSQRPCNLGVMDQLLNPRENAFALQKGSNLLRRVNRAIRTLAQENTIARLHRKWWKGKCNRLPEDDIDISGDGVNESSQEKSTYQSDASEGKTGKTKPKPVSNNSHNPGPTGRSVLSRACSPSRYSSFTLLGICLVFLHLISSNLCDVIYVHKMT